MKRLFVSMLLAMAMVSACNNDSPDSSDGPPHYEAKTTQFCRASEYGSFADPNFERYRELNREVLTELANEGWEYQGIIHNDGINCSVVYFRRVARPPQPSIVDAGVTGG